MLSKWNTWNCTWSPIEADNLAISFENIGFRDCIHKFSHFEFIEILPTQVLFGYQGLKSKSSDRKYLLTSHYYILLLDTVETPNAL